MNNNIADNLWTERANDVWRPQRAVLDCAGLDVDLQNAVSLR